MSRRRGGRERSVRSRPSRKSRGATLAVPPWDGPEGLQQRAGGGAVGGERRRGRARAGSALPRGLKPLLHSPPPGWPRRDGRGAGEGSGPAEGASRPRDGSVARSAPIRAPPRSKCGGRAWQPRGRGSRGRREGRQFVRCRPSPPLRRARRTRPRLGGRKRRPHSHPGAGAREGCPEWLQSAIAGAAARGVMGRGHPPRGTRPPRPPPRSRPSCRWSRGIGGT
mmetsp:Transcript_11532/g.25857  ORF Transcript_11532/g.25857 Transcript_11532/m.25857 type:complete len:223 (+) Transcript_11532:552-1220(+)